MKNKEVVYTVKLLGSIGLKTKMFIRDNFNERIEVKALVVTKEAVFICTKNEDENIHNATSYVKEVESKNIEDLLNLDVKVYLGSASELLSNKETIDKNKVKDIKAISYSRGVFDFSLNE